VPAVARAEVDGDPVGALDPLGELADVDFEEGAA
jgi:hypothetical protein